MVPIAESLHRWHTHSKQKQSDPVSASLLLHLHEQAYKLTGINRTKIDLIPRDQNVSHAHDGICTGVDPPIICDGQSSKGKTVVVDLRLMNRADFAGGGEEWITCFASQQA